ncbi:MAG: HAMP domain-containing protein [Gammaproteobacteria bacterium]|nr:HAMP domain-containing protein [Gammaproteobacteria bacterium]
MKRRSLSRRIAGAFLGMAALAGVFGGLLAVLFAYTTEDHLFDRLLALESTSLSAGFTKEAGLPELELPFARYYLEAELPAELREPLLAEPRRREIFAADGRHFHLQRVPIPGSDQSVWVVLQVEDYLVVRPVLSEITAMLAISVLGIVLLAGAVGLFLAHRVTRPLRSLADEVTALEPDQLPKDWAVHYPPDEAGQLADALRDAFQRIECFVEREQRFTQDASHELRTPLTVIENSATVLGKSPDAGQVHALAARIRSAAMAMHLSVEALLNLARERTGRDEAPTTAVLPIVERTIVSYSQLLEGKPVALEVAIDPHWRVAGDAAALQVLIANLVSNAFRHTERGTIRIERDGEDLLVVDSGAGIDEAIRPQVTRARVKSPDSPGLGLGLSICERLCERCGWRFELDSSGTGTTARLCLDGDRNSTTGHR